MDQNTKLTDLKSEVQKFCEDRDWDQFHNAKELAIGLITESSELLEHFRFRTDDQIREMFKSEKTRTEISHELADTFFFVLRFAQMFDIDLSEALRDKMGKNAQRYPVEKAKGSNAKYDEL